MQKIERQRWAQRLKLPPQMYAAAADVQELAGAAEQGSLGRESTVRTAAQHEWNCKCTGLLVTEASLVLGDAARHLDQAGAMLERQAAGASARQRGSAGSLMPAGKGWQALMAVT